MSRPTIHVTNWSSRTLHHGRVYTIMAKPRQWEHGDGTIQELVPAAEDLDAVKAGRITMEEYSARFHARVRRVVLRPENHPVLRDGDTVCCACSRAEAAAGRCHRVWSAYLLVQAGWRVVLDGTELEAPHAG